MKNEYGITVDEKEFYYKNGYLLTGRPLFSESKFEGLSKLFEEHLAQKGDKGSDELDVPHFKDERLFDYLMAPEILEVVEGIIGSNIGLWSSHFICKEPMVGRRTPWHEDSAYWKGKFDSFDGIVTVWLAIDRATKENGCMGVVPGTHLNGFSEYENIKDSDSTFDTEIKTKVKVEDVVWFELEKNNYSLHDSRIIHGANANTSSSRRTGYTMRYFNLDLKLNREHPGNKTHKIYYCRGRNTGQNPLIYL